MIFIDATFVNRIDLHSQIDYVICLIDDVDANLIHWSSIKCKRVIRSVLAIELYVMINDFDVESIIKSIIERILELNNSLSLILLTDSKSLYDCLVKLNTIAEKRLMIDLICLRQSYKRKKLQRSDELTKTSNLQMRWRSQNSATFWSNLLTLILLSWKSLNESNVRLSISDKNILMR
jgi:hypothetical protein